MSEVKQLKDITLDDLYNMPLSEVEKFRAWIEDLRDKGILESRLGTSTEEVVFDLVPPPLQASAVEETEHLKTMRISPDLGAGKSTFIETGKQLKSIGELTEKEAKKLGLMAADIPDDAIVINAKPSTPKPKEITMESTVEEIIEALNK